MKRTRSAGRVGGRVVAMAIVVLTILVLAATPSARAATKASDAATDAAYAQSPSGAWQGTGPTEDENPAGSDNGGFGFGVWDFRGGFHNPDLSPYGELNHFIDGVDFTASSYNDLGSPAFGLTNANQPFFGYAARGTRTFAPLEVGETLSFNFDSPALQPLDPTDDTGFLIRLNSGGGPVVNNDPIAGVAERFGLVAVAGFNGDRWHTYDAGGMTDTGLDDIDTASGATFRFTLTDTESYAVELLSLDSQEVLFAGDGSLQNSGAGVIDTIELTLYGNGSGGGPDDPSPTGEREFFFNNLQITSAGEAVAGDYTGDGVVDAADYAVWRDNLGSAASLPGDDTPGVGADDYERWKSSFGQSTSGAAAAVPAPKSIAIGLTGMAALGFRTRAARVVAVVWNWRPQRKRRRHSSVPSAASCAFNAYGAALPSNGLMKTFRNRISPPCVCSWIGPRL